MSDSGPWSKPLSTGPDDDAEWGKKELSINRSLPSGPNKAALLQRAQWMFLLHGTDRRRVDIAPLTLAQITSS